MSITTYDKDSQLKAYALPAGKKTAYLSDARAENLFCVLRAITNTKTQKVTSVSKTFIYFYMKDGKRHSITVGKYPEISIAQARAIAADYSAKRENKDEADPKPERREAQRLAKTAVKTFADLVNEYETILKSKVESGKLSQLTVTRDIQRINKHLTSYFKNTPLKDLSGKVLTARIAALIEQAKNSKDEPIKRNKIGLDTVKKVFWILRKMMKYARGREYIDFNPIADIDFDETFESVETKKNHYNAIIEPERFGELMRAIDENAPMLRPTTRHALYFAAHTALRSANIRGLKWEFIDFEKNLIIFPAATMKGREEFKLPISKQVRAILEAQKEHGGRELVFPSDIAKGRQMSENTLNQAIKRLGFGEETVQHGFRRTFSTFSNQYANQHGKSIEVIEYALDHRERTTTRRAYNEADHLDNLRELFQWYSDLLDKLSE